MDWEGSRIARRARAIGTLLVIGFLVLLLGRLTVDEVFLDLRHDVAEATITKVEPGRSVDFARVEFQDARGRTRTARIQLSWWPHDTEVGDSQRIDYDPSRPSRARRHGAHDPFALWPVAVGLGLAVVLGIGGRSRLRRNVGRSVDEGSNPGPRSNVHVREADVE